MSMVRSILSQIGLRVRPYKTGLSYIRRVGRIVWQAAGWWTAMWFAILLIQGLVPAAVVYVTRWVVDAVAGAVGRGITPDTLQIVLVPAVVMGGLLFLQRTLSSLLEWVTVIQSELVQDHAIGLIHEKATTIDYAFYESSDFLDLLNQAKGQASSNALSVQRAIGSILSGFVTLVSISVLLLQYAWWLPVLLVVGTLPGFAVLLRHNRKLHEWWKRNTEERRRAQYFDTMLTIPNAAAEVRLYMHGPFFQRAYQAIRARLRSERAALVGRKALASAGAGLLALLVIGGTMAWICWRAFMGLASLGDVALFYQAFNQGHGVLAGILGGFGRLYTDSLFLQHLFEFLDHELEIADPPSPQPFPAPVRDGIRFSGVDFTYPGTSKPILQNFSLHLPAGRIVAIVGENGAGKSTFTKLICRFYDPDAGRVSIDGVDLRDLKVEDLRRNITLMVQDPARYQQSAEENIAIADMSRAGENQKIVEAADHAGIHEYLETLPDGYRTQLGRYFRKGTELSGGQWRRIALARSIFRETPILILDEPTSFMDSWSEMEWIERLKRFAEGRTVLYITHRFTTAMQADIIHVMKKGHIVESGSHKELLVRGGQYATSWNAQMRMAAQHENGAASAADHAVNAFAENEVVR